MDIGGDDGVVWLKEEEEEEETTLKTVRRRRRKKDKFASSFSFQRPTERATDLTSQEGDSFFFISFLPSFQIQVVE